MKDIKGKLYSIDKINENFRSMCREKWQNKRCRCNESLQRVARFSMQAP